MEKFEGLVLPKVWVGNSELYKPVLNKTMVIPKKCLKYDLVAPLRFFSPFLISCFWRACIHTGKFPNWMEKLCFAFFWRPCCLCYFWKFQFPPLFPLGFSKNCTFKCCIFSQWNSKSFFQVTSKTIYFFTRKCLPLFVFIIFRHILFV